MKEGYKKKQISVPQQLFDIIYNEAHDRRMNLNALIILILADHIRRKESYEQTDDTLQNKGDR